MPTEHLTPKTPFKPLHPPRNGYVFFPTSTDVPRHPKISIMEEPTTPATAHCPPLAARRRVRVVGKITDPIPRDPKSESTAEFAKGIRVSVLKSEGESPKHATVLFEGGRNGCKASYKLDWCYEHGEGVEKLFVEEVKPMIQGVFNGADASIIAFGAKGSGKTLLIEGTGTPSLEKFKVHTALVLSLYSPKYDRIIKQSQIVLFDGENKERDAMHQSRERDGGCVEKPGLAPLAAAEILDLCKNSSYSVRISCYEIFQDRIFDILKQKEQEVQVLEDGHGRTQLRGLSQNHIESIVDFNRLYISSCKPQTAYQKTPNDCTIKSHKGLVLHVCDGKSQADVGRINFIDLAGYEYTTQKTNSKPQILECTRINKSLYSLQNVIFALNTNERHVPYRGSKLTHMLKDSISREKSQTLMVACLKSRHSQETIRAVGMASYSCMATSDSGKKNKSIPRPTPGCSPSDSWSQIANASTKKCAASRLALLDKKLNAVPSMAKGRKLFGMQSPVTKSVEKLNPEDKSSSGITFNVEFLDQDKESLREASENSNCEKDNCSSNVITGVESIVSQMDHLEVDKDGGCSEKMPRKSNEGAGQEIHESVCNFEEQSPPISEKLRAIANSLRALRCQPLGIVASYGNICEANKDSCESIELKTSRYLSNLDESIYKDNDISRTPREIFKTRSSGLKRSLAQELLAYINNATKEELMELKGIGEKRANLILEIRAESPQAFKDMNDLKDIGLSSKQANEMMKGILGDYYA